MTLKKLAGALMAVGLGAAAGLASSGAHAQVSGDKVKIGYITDLSGLYADIDGQGGVEAVKMAIEDAGGKVL
ncbi:ABC transporter permease, partial [Acinetobacter baumannii]